MAGEAWQEGGVLRRALEAGVGAEESDAGENALARPPQEARGGVEGGGEGGGEGTEGGDSGWLLGSGGSGRGGRRGSASAPRP
eukprot:4608085-Pleurochrysis_carterae.AAC.1